MTNAPHTPGASSPAGPSLSQYLLANAIFWGWLVALFLVAKFMIKETSAMLFVLGTLGVAFTVVSAADWAFERCGSRRDTGGAKRDAAAPAATEGSES